MGLFTRKRLSIIATLTAAIFCPATGSKAASTVYTSRSAFDAATINQQLITFSGLTGPSTATAYNIPINTLTTGGVTFTSNAPGGSLYVIDTQYNYDSFYFAGGGGPYLNNNHYDGTRTLTAALPAGVRAVGGDFGYQTPNGSIANFNAFIGLSTGENFVYSLPTSDNFPIDDRAFSFLGFVSDVDITSLTFRANGVEASQGSGSLDNFTLAEVPAVEVPEPTTAALATLSLAVLGFGAWRRSR